MRRSAIGEREEDVIAIEQLVHRLHSLRHDVFHVLGDQADFAAVNSTFLVDLIKRHPQRLGIIRALHGGHAG